MGYATCYASGVLADDDRSVAADRSAARLAGRLARRPRVRPACMNRWFLAAPCCRVSRGDRHTFGDMVSATTAAKAKEVGGLPPHAPSWHSSHLRWGHCTRSLVSLAPAARRGPNNGVAFVRRAPAPTVRVPDECWGCRARLVIAREPHFGNGAGRSGPWEAGAWAHGIPGHPVVSAE